jgi:putative transcriptional regulator
MRKQHCSALMASLHGTAEGLHSTSIMDKQMMRQIDDVCLAQVRFDFDCEDFCGYSTSKESSSLTSFANFHIF